jgi:hypothetical protein
MVTWKECLCLFGGPVFWRAWAGRVTFEGVRFSYNPLITRAALFPPTLMAAASHEKPLSPDSYTETPVQPKKSTLFSAFSPLANAHARFFSWRTALGLPNPGTVENLQKEVKSEYFILGKLLGRA